MANVTGPTNNLPGDSRTSPPGNMCDRHENVIAYRRVTGETDSFGSEEEDLCEACWNKYQQAIKKPIISNCDWCKTPDVEVKSTRDFEEGTHGPVYDVCEACRRRQAQAIEDY